MLHPTRRTVSRSNLEKRLGFLEFQHRSRPQLSIIKKAVGLARAAVLDERKAYNLDRLALWLRRQVRITEDNALLAEAASCSREATTILSKNDHYWPRFNCTLAIVLQQQYDAGDAESLDEALLVARTAVENTRDNHPHKAACLAVLSGILRMEWMRKGRLEILSEAIDRGKEAVRRTGSDDPYLASRVKLLKLLLCDGETRG
jgi:hypothetical protein